jgi:hypothetical protein
MTRSAAPTRRDFLATSTSALGGVWLASALPALAALSACARDAAQRGDAFTTLTAAEGEAMTAFAANIIPSDEAVPGATEAGAVYFVDAALGSLFVPMRDPVKQGLADLDKRAAGMGAANFASLAADQQIGVMKQVEDTPFFFQARMLTMMGVLSDPKYGGNRNGAGFELIRREHGGAWQPPFGYYDAESGDVSAEGGA